MTEIVTYEWINNKLSNINQDNKLSFIDFQRILSYLYKKLAIMIKLRKKKDLFTRDLNLVYSVLTMLEFVINQNLITETSEKQLMLNLLEEYESKLVIAYSSNSSIKEVV